MTRLLALALVGQLLACVSDDFADGQFLCDPEGGPEQCPDGLQCALDQRCRRLRSCATLPHSPGLAESVSQGDKDVAWLNLDRLTVPDGSRVTTGGGLAPGQSTQRLVASAFELTLPPDAGITGIQVTIKKDTLGSGTVVDLEVRLARAGAPAPLDLAEHEPWPYQQDRTALYDGALWGAEWTPQELNAPDFAVWLRGKNVDSVERAAPRVDHIAVTVSYTSFVCPAEGE
jgi:hypothetical protein